MREDIMKNSVSEIATLAEGVGIGKSKNEVYVDHELVHVSVSNLEMSLDSFLTRICMADPHLKEFYSELQTVLNDRDEWDVEWDEPVVCAEELEGLFTTSTSDAPSKPLYNNRASRRGYKEPTWKKKNTYAR